MTRREWLAGAGAGAIALMACGQENGAKQIAANVAVATGADPFSGAGLMADVEFYVGFGTHRTGSPGDVATSEWFAKHWRELGYEVEQTEFSVPNADTTVARLEAGGEVFDGFAQPPLSVTPEAGVTAPLTIWKPGSPADVVGKIALVHIARAPGASSPSAAYRDAFRKAALAKAEGVVGVISGPSGEIVAINTPVEMQLATPVLQIGEKDKARLDAIAASKQPVKLTITGSWRIQERQEHYCTSRSGRIVGDHLHATKRLVRLRRRARTWHRDVARFVGVGDDEGFSCSLALHCDIWP